MTTPFAYPDKVRQEKNEAGHKAEREIFSAFAKGEDKEGGVQYKLDRDRKNTKNWFIETGILTGPEKYVLLESPNCEFLLIEKNVIRRYLEIHPTFEEACERGFTHDQLLQMTKDNKFTRKTTSVEENVEAYLINADKLRNWCIDRAEKT